MGENREAGARNEVLLDLNRILKKGAYDFRADHLGLLPALLRSGDGRGAAPEVRNALKSLFETVLAGRQLAFALALFGFSDEGRGLTLNGRRELAGKIIRPENPISADGLRRRNGREEGLLITLTDEVMSSSVKHGLLDSESPLRVSETHDVQVLSTAVSGLSDTIIAQVELFFQRGDYASVLRYRETFSRFLWVEGYIDARLKLGAFVEEAALRQGDRQSQVAALIDDLGWTSVAAKLYKQADTHIRHGLRLAESEKLHYWTAKGHRHLAGIATELGETTRANNELLSVLQLATAITEPTKRCEIEAGAHTALVFNYLHPDTQDLQAALTHVDAAQEAVARIDDPTRMVRFHSLRAKILEQTGESALANDEYRLGLAESRRVGRRDEQIRNLNGLARLANLDGESTLASQYETEAKELSAQTPVPFES